MRRLLHPREVGTNPGFRLTLASQRHIRAKVQKSGLGQSGNSHCGWNTQSCSHPTQNVDYELRHEESSNG
jgi:hypothetical protein